MFLVFKTNIMYVQYTHLLNISIVIKHFGCGVLKNSGK